MGISIERFKISKLHGTRDYTINIRDNRIVMVGVNGLGKTTVVNLLFLMLSRQWDRILDYDFESVTLTINGEEFELVQEKKTQPSSINRRLRTVLHRYLPADVIRPLQETPLSSRLVAAVGSGNPEDLAVFLDRSTPLTIAQCRKIASQLFQLQRSFNQGKLELLEKKLTEHAENYRVLYLPTYRRIEKELSLIFPDLEDSVRNYQQRKVGPLGPNRRSYIELVEFGMEDVETTFRRARTELIETGRAELNGLAGGYLRDVIRGEGENYQIDTFHKLNETTINRILNRAEETTLSEVDKARLRAVIEKLKNPPPDGPEVVDRYIAHFFSKLIKVDEALSEKERLIASFTEVCNKYLTGKSIVYDDRDSSIRVKLDRNSTPLELKSLSSGEKQIVSLFSHLYLHERGHVMVIIDEPELSLSVTWQEQLLPHILETNRCVFLAAVTHSPFVFNNSLDPYAVNLTDCITEAAK